MLFPSQYNPPGFHFWYEGKCLVRLPFYKFQQYYAMANLDVDMEPSYKTKHIANSQFTPRQFSQRLNGPDHIRRKPSCPGPAVGRDPVEMWKGHLCGFRGETEGLDEFTTRSLLPVSSTPSVTRFMPDIGIPVVTSPMAKALDSIEDNQVNPVLYQKESTK
ncbi:hypothetical protein D5086_010952 [Populus alba]|uniref:Uncharacterized protein n=1 Tax=Populus alba TaxID=43335 RepID=A0ACC4CAU5_POPAL